MNENVNQKGKVTELEVLSYVIKLGYSVSIPFGDKDRYDQIWDINGQLLRVQVKTASAIDKQESAIKFSCRSISNGRATNYSKEDIDYFATFWNEKVYLVPVEECSNQKTLRFFSNSQQSANINWAENYTMETILNLK